MCGFLNTVIASYPTRNVCNIFSTLAFFSVFWQETETSLKVLWLKTVRIICTSTQPDVTKSAARAGSEAAPALLNKEEKEVAAAAVARVVPLDDDDVFA